MDDLDFIVGLMKENHEAIGFIPSGAIAERYLLGQCIMQTDIHGNRRGYLLHGKPTAGGVLTVSQAVIDYDFRKRGYGELAVRELLARANRVNAKQIKLRCAANLEANAFWLAQGFTPTKIEYPDNRRKRAIITYVKDLWPLLFAV